MKLIGSYVSPFVRIVRIVCHELGLEYEHDVTGPFGKLTPEQDELVNTHNPLMKVPILIDDGEMLLDSRVIVTYLLRNHPSQKNIKSTVPYSIKEENLISVIYGVMEAGVLRFVMSKDDINLNEGYMVRSLERIKLGLTYLDSQSELGSTFGYPEISLICCLDWFKKREIFDWSQLNHLAKTHTAYSERESLVQTRIPDDL